MEELIEALRWHIRQTGLTQEDLARDIGVRVVTVNRWFNGHILKMHKVTEKAVRRYIKRHNLEVRS